MPGNSGLDGRYLEADIFCVGSSEYVVEGVGIKQRKRLRFGRFKLQLFGWRDAGRSGQAGVADTLLWDGCLHWLDFCRRKTNKARASWNPGDWFDFGWLGGSSEANARGSRWAGI